MKVTIRTRGFTETARACAQIPRFADRYIDEAAHDIAAANAARMRAVGSSNRQAAIAARTARAVRGTVTVGGTGRSGAVVFGAEFGAATSTPGGFRPYRGHTGYFIWPTVRATADAGFRRWTQAADDIVDAWERA